MTSKQAISPITTYYKSIVRNTPPNQALRERWEEDIWIDGLPLKVHLKRIKHGPIILEDSPIMRYKKRRVETGTDQKVSTIGQSYISKQEENTNDEWYMVDMSENGAF